MLEIVFRGRNNSKWQYGDLIHLRDGRVAIGKNCEPFPREVIPKTVGQYIGATDMNDKKIFEGDVVRYEGENYEIKYLEKYSRFAATKPDVVFAVFSFKRAEIVGNVFDNPELLRE